MPKRIDLYNQHIDVQKTMELDPGASEVEGAPVTAEKWTLSFTDKTYGDQIRISFNKQVRDEVVKMLTGGIVLAGGDLPSV